MDRYKFRAKAIEEMADGNQWIEDGFGVHNVDLVDGGVDCVLYTPHGTYHVDPATVGQITGLKDKNGKEIYEGDILRVIYIGGGTATSVSAVTFEDGCYMFSERSPFAPVYYKIPLKAVIGHGNYDVTKVGNIHDNPELLEG